MATSFESVSWGYDRPPVWTLTGALKAVFFATKVAFICGAERKITQKATKKPRNARLFCRAEFIKR